MSIGFLVNQVLWKIACSFGHFIEHLTQESWKKDGTFPLVGNSSPDGSGGGAELAVTLPWRIFLTVGRRKVVVP